MGESFARTALFVTGSLLIWAADFLFIYVFAALACARGFAGMTVAGVGVVHWASGLSTAIAVVATVAIVRAARRGRTPAEDTRAFRAQVAGVVAVLSLIAIGLTGLPGLLVQGVCG